nr:amino acid adenylation domain-containing protein [Pseudomonas sp. BIGb0427]
MCIAGDSLARGYHARPGLTAERFVPDPFAAQPGGRLYRTGDLGCYATDGQIEYAGRVDHQVKVRGFRIETGEIERHLLAHARVRDAVVVARQEHGVQQLVGYLVGPTRSCSRTRRRASNCAASCASPGFEPAGAHAADTPERRCPSALDPERQARPQGLAGAGRQQRRQQALSARQHGRCSSRSPRSGRRSSSLSGSGSTTSSSSWAAIHCWRPR